MKVGDTVRLRNAGTKKTATVLRINHGGGVLLDKRLIDFVWWHREDLEVVRRSGAASSEEKK